MGQYWVVADLDGRTYLDLGKLGDSLPYENATADFINYLSLPSKKTYGLGSPPKEQLKKWLVLCNWNTPIRLPRSQKCRPIDQEEEMVATSELHSIKSSIQTMPADIHILIFDMLEEFADVLCLALASERLFRSGEKRIQATSKESVPWAGHRLICVGDYLENEDIPHGLLTSEEQEELNHGRDDLECTIYHLATSRFRVVEAKQPLRPASFYYQFGSRAGFAGMRINCRVFTDIVKWLDDKSNIDESKPKELVLRNLTKRQYVRANSTSTALGTVLLARICWSSDPSCAMAYNEHDLTRGVWAGDRFDITSLDRLEEGERTPGLWTDVSKEVDDEMARIWESEYGEGWRKKNRW